MTTGFKRAHRARLRTRVGRTPVWVATTTALLSVVAIVLIVNRSAVLPGQVQAGKSAEVIDAPVSATLAEVPQKPIRQPNKGQGPVTSQGTAGQDPAERVEDLASRSLREGLETTLAFERAGTVAPDPQVSDAPAEPSTLESEVSEADAEVLSADSAETAVPGTGTAQSETAYTQDMTAETILDSTVLEASTAAASEAGALPATTETSTGNAQTERLREQLTALEVQLLLTDLKVAIYAGNSQRVLQERLAEVETLLRAAYEAAGDPIWTTLEPGLQRLERRLTARLSARHLIGAVDAFTETFTKTVTIPRLQAVPLPAVTAKYTAPSSADTSSLVRQNDVSAFPPLTAY